MENLSSQLEKAEENNTIKILNKWKAVVSAGQMESGSQLKSTQDKTKKTSSSKSSDLRTNDSSQHSYELLHPSFR